MIKKILLAAPALLVAGYFGAKAYVQYKVSDDIDRIIKILSPHAAIDYKTISTTMSGELTVDDVSVVMAGHTDAIAIERIGIDMPDFWSLLKLGDARPGRQLSGAFPESFGIIVDSVSLRAQDDYYDEVMRSAGDENAPAIADDPLGHCVGRYGLQADFLDALGFDTIVFSSYLSIEPAKAGTSFSMRYSMAPLFDWNIDMVLQGGFKQIARVANKAPTLVSLRAEFIEQTDPALRIDYCQTLGVDEQILQDGSLAFALEALAEAGIVPDEPLIDAYREFLDQRNQTFIVTAQPSNPVDLSRMRFYNPNDIPALLNINAETR